MAFYKSHILSTTLSCDEGTDLSITSISLIPAPSTISQSDKYRSAFTIAQKAATLISEVSMVEYRQRLSVLKKLVNSWENGVTESLYDMEDEVFNIV